MTAVAFAAPPALAPSLPPIDAHIADLGFDSALAYRLWCHRSGFDNGLAKDEAQRRLEREAALTRPRLRHQTEARRRMHERLAAGQIDCGCFGGRLPEDDPGSRRAMVALLRHADSFTDVCDAGRVLRRGPQRTLAWGLAQLARHCAAWLRPVEAFAPEGDLRDARGRRIRGRLFHQLARHLLARYEVPDFMDTCWFETDEAAARQQQAWFIHVAQGGNIRRADTPIRLTRRMAHVFPLAPRREPLLRNLRWAQVIGMGGSEELARSILRTRLGRRFEDDEFWSSVVLFLVHNAMLDPTWVGPVVDYVHNMKYAPRRVVRAQGGVEEGPPPHPEFTMKGRSATKLLRQVEAWHGNLSRESYVQFQTWPPCGVRPMELEDETEELGRVRWTVQELLSSWELAAEGTAMNHCVVSYSDQCADGQTAIWSIGAWRDGSDEREGVLTVALDIRERTVTQARGRHNALPHRKPTTARMRRATQGGYWELLNRSDHVLRAWLDREGLRRST